MYHSLINTNQMRSFNILVHDNTFDATVFGIEADESFTSFTSKGTVISFESQVQTKWEEHNLPVIYLIGDQWDPMNV